MTVASANDFACIVPKNRIVVVPAQWIGKTVHVTVGRRKASTGQFGWYRGVALPILAEHLGYDKDEIEYLHDAVLIACYGKKLDPLGREVPAHRTRKSNTKEMAEFQEWFSRWCAKEHGVSVPMPNESEVA